MKRMRKLIVFVFIVVLIVILKMKPAYASANVPYRTYTIGAGGRLVLTQTAYIPVGILNYNVQLNAPEDLYIKDDKVYIADTGNKRIIKMNLDGEVELEIKLDEENKEYFTEPSGVFVDHKDIIYVADRGAQLVYKFTSEGELIRTYGRPVEPLFGKNSPYVPEKIAVDKRGNLYVVGVGSTHGVIQMNYNGNFLGFYGANKAAKKSFLARLFETEQDAKNNPPSTLNITIDHKGLVYTVSANVSDPIKRLNVASINTLSTDIIYPSEKIKDVYINSIDNIFVITETGRIWEYDSFGNLLFVFGSNSIAGERRLGLTKDPSGIAIDSNDNLYVLDSSYNDIQIYQATEFVNVVHQGIKMYKDGKYKESTEIWQNVLRMNSAFALAHSSLGKSYYKFQDYDAALEEYYLAKDRAGYSEAYWHLRYAWMQEHLGVALIIVIFAFLLMGTVRRIDYKTGIFNPIRQKTKMFKQKRLVSELMLLFRVFKNPADTYYEIKHRKKSSYKAALIIYGFMFIGYIIHKLFTAFIFNYTNISRVNLFYEIAVFFGIIILFVFSNYLISTLHDGEGWFKDIFISTSYACAPYIIGIIPLTILSHALTNNERFVYEFLYNMIIVATAIMLFVMIKEIHNYTIKETIKNVLLTLFTMAIIVLILFIIYMLLNQVYDFLYSILYEVILRGKYA